MSISLTYILIFSSQQRLGLHIDLFPVGLHVKILKALLPSSIVVTWKSGASGSSFESLLHDPEME